jgi:sugar lactone lactonase YvrE
MRRTILALIFVLSAVAPAWAQTNTINTIAGGGTQPSAATSANLPQPWTAVRDIHGNTYISAPSLNVVYKVDTTGALTTYAGTGTPGNTGDGGPATQAELAFPAGLAVDATGNLFIADSNNNRIRRVDTSGNITTVAGSGDTFFGGFSGDGGPATSAQLNVPSSVAVDGNDDLFITDTDNGLVRRVDGVTQTITTIAGEGSTFGCNGGGGNTARFNFLNGIAVDGTGNVFIADVGLGIVCKIDATTQNITTYAGTINSFGQPGAANGDGGPATSAQMDQPNGVAVDSQGNLFITDSGNPKIRKVDTTANHIITSIAGTGFICVAEPACGDGAAATSAAFDFPRGVFVDANNNIIVTDTFNMRVRVVAAGTNPNISAFAGGGAVGDGGQATSAILADPAVVVVDGAENIFELEQQGLRLRRIDATTKVITTYAGAGLGGATIGLGINGDGGPATNARFVNPVGLATDSAGNYYIVDHNLAQVKKIDTSNPPIITTIAGNGAPCGVAGNPNTTPGCGDGGAATSASLSQPVGVAVDSKGNVYISDTGLNTVRVVTASTGNISTFAGISGSPCQSTPANCGDGGAATSAQLNIPFGMAFDSSNNLFIADTGDNVIRVVNTVSNDITTFALNGLPSFGGDGGPAQDASMDGPQEVAADAAGNLFISGGNDNVVRRVDRQDQTIVTVAGDVNNLDGGFSGDGGPSTQALLENFGVAVFNNANGTHDLFIADGGNARIRKVNIAPVAPGQPATGSTLTFPTTLDGQVSDLQSIQFANTGLDRLVFSNIVLSNQNFILFNGCNQGGAGPAGSCALQIEFAPQSGVSGTQTTTLTFNTNDPANPTYTYNLTGTASNAPSTLGITESGSGTGFVTSDPLGINCPSTCTGTFGTGSTVTVTASPNAGSSFTSWNTANAPGAVCTGNSCVVTLNFSQTLNAVFGPATVGTFTVNVSVLGNGAGSVTSNPANTGNITCTAANSPCAFVFPGGTSNVTLSETPTGTGSVFAGWLSSTCSFSGLAACDIESGGSGSVSTAAVFSGPAKPFAKGQVFLSTDAGMVFVLDPTAGSVVQVLNSGSSAVGHGDGMTFDANGNLILVNNGANTVLTFNNQGAGPTSFGDDFQFNQPFSPVVDPFGNVFIAQTVLDGDRLLEFSSGANSATFFPAFEGDVSIANWVELLASSDRVAYTLGTQTVKILDLGEDFQRPDLVTNLHGAFALRQLPDATLLVADTDRIVRLDQNGNITQTYTIPSTPAVFQNLNLDPDGATFWTNDELTGIVYRINIASGAVANGSGFTTGVGLNSILGTLGVGGIAVFGQPASGGADLSVTMTGPATISAGGTATYTIVATNNGPLAATGVTMSAFIQNGAFTITNFTAPTGVSCQNDINISTNDDTRFCTIGAMASGASDTFSVSVQPTGTITNSATMADSAPADPNLLNNTATVTTTITAATLVSIAVTPNPASVVTGGTQQFTATGTFSDNSTQNLTSTATWSSSNTAIATINAAGLASGVTAGGPVTVTAAQSGINGTAALTVTAAPPPTFTLTVATAGTGNGTVTSQAGLAPAISCTTGSGTGCTASYNSGQSVVLTATPLATNNSTFAGWSGACTNTTGTCSVTMNQAQSVTATFNLTGATPTFTSTTLQAGAVGIPYGADLQALVSGGVQPYSFAVTTGSLPTGFQLDAVTSEGVLGGHVFNDSPAAAGTFTFGVTVTDSSSPTPQTAAATISLTIAGAPANTQASLLRGQYALLVKNIDEGGNFEGIAGSLTFDGKGNLTGIVDDNSTSSGVTIAANVTGTYTVGPDNRGTLKVVETGQPNTVTIAIAVGGVHGGVATSATIVDFNDDDANHNRGSGTLQLQDPTSFTKAIFAGTYASQLTGQSSAGARSVYTGLFTFDNIGSITAFLDTNDGGTLTSGPTATGSYTGPDANGRVVLSLPGPPFEDVIYQVSANEWIYQSLNPKAGGNDVDGGLGLRQTNPNSFSTASIVGPDVLSLAGSSGVGESFALIGQATASAGTFTVLADKNDGGNVTTNQTTSGTFTMAANGRGVVTTSTGTLIIYLATPDTGFVVIQDSSVASGRLKPQVGGPFSNASVVGPYFFGTEEILTGSGGGIDSGAATVGSGNLNVTDDESDPGGDLFFGQSQSFPVTVAASGRITLATGTNNTSLGYMSSPLEFQVFDGNTSSDHPNIIEVQSITAAPGTPSPATATVNFATPVVVGTTAQSAPITITNTGLGPLTFLTVQATADFTPNGGTCLNPTPVTLQPQATCTLIVTFAPTSTTPINTPLNELTVVTTDGTNNVQITCTGTAASAGGISVTPSSTVNFGNQLINTTSGAITTTITNTSTTQTVTINSVALSPLPNAAGTNPDGFTIVPGEGNCSADTTLQANGGFCVLPVTFGPTATGTVSSTITLSDSAGSQVITLNGTGTAPTISLNPTSLTFSAAPDTTSAAQTVTVTNSGAAPLHIANVTLGGTDAEDFAFVNGTTPCAKGVTVQPQATCTVGVDFTAPSQATFNATVTVTSDASNGAQTIPLTGTGVVISITPPPGGTTTATTNPGGTAVFPLVLSSTGLTGNATLTCLSPQTPTITCTVVPGTVALTPNGVTHTAIVVNTFCQGTTPSSGSVPGNPTQNLPPAPWLIAIVGLALLVSMALTKKRSLRLVMPLAALLLAGIFVSSCGSPPKGPNGITPPGIYSLVITATVGQASSSITLTLTVN